jgi:hypothetical protein
MEGNFSDPKVGLKLTILPSCFGITVFGHPPFPKEAPGIIAVVRIRGIHQRTRRGRRGIRGAGRPIGPDKERMESVIQDESTGELEKGIVNMNRRCLILPHTADALPNRHLLRYLLRLALATIVFSNQGCYFDLKKEKGGTATRFLRAERR